MNNERRSRSSDSLLQAKRIVCKMRSRVSESPAVPVIQSIVGARIPPEDKVLALNELVEMRDQIKRAVRTAYETGEAESYLSFLGPERFNLLKRDMLTSGQQRRQQKQQHQQKQKGRSRSNSANGSGGSSSSEERDSRYGVEFVATDVYVDPDIEQDEDKPCGQIPSVPKIDVANLREEMMNVPSDNDVPFSPADPNAPATAGSQKQATTSLSTRTPRVFEDFSTPIFDRRKFIRSVPITSSLRTTAAQTSDVETREAEVQTFRSPQGHSSTVSDVVDKADKGVDVQSFDDVERRTSPDGVDVTSSTRRIRRFSESEGSRSSTPTDASPGQLDLSSRRTSDRRKNQSLPTAAIVTVRRDGSIVGMETTVSGNLSDRKMADGRRDFGELPASLKRFERSPKAGDVQSDVRDLMTSTASTTTIETNSKAEKFPWRVVQEFSDYQSAMAFVMQKAGTGSPAPVWREYGSSSSSPTATTTMVVNGAAGGKKEAKPREAALGIERLNLDSLDGADPISPAEIRADQSCDGERMSRNVQQRKDSDKQIAMDENLKRILAKAAASGSLPEQPTISRIAASPMSSTDGHRGRAFEEMFNFSSNSVHRIRVAERDILSSSNASMAASPTMPVVVEEDDIQTSPATTSKGPPGRRDGREPNGTQLPTRMYPPTSSTSSTSTASSGGRDNNIKDGERDDGDVWESHADDEETCDQISQITDASR